MPRIDVREARSEDLPAILKLVEQLNIGKEEGLSLRDARVILEHIHAMPEQRVYVAAREGEIIGTFTLLLLRGLAHGGSPHGVIEDVVVEPNWRGHGVGKRMMYFAMERCRESGCYKIALSSHLSREKTHAFYEALGFRKHGFSFLMLLSGVT